VVRASLLRGYWVALAPRSVQPCTSPAPTATTECEADPDTPRLDLASSMPDLWCVGDAWRMRGSLGRMVARQRASARYWNKGTPWPCAACSWQARKRRLGCGAAPGTAGVHLLSSHVSPNGSVTCGGNWHYRCTPLIIVDESERLRNMWWPLARVCASHHRRRVRMGP